MDPRSRTSSRTPRTAAAGMLLQIELRNRYDRRVYLETEKRARAIE